MEDPRQGEAPTLYHLRTIDGFGVSGPAGPVELPEAEAGALLVLLALSGAQGVAVDEVLLRLTPDLTPTRGREVILGWVAELNRALGADTVHARGERWQLAPGRVDSDVMLTTGGQVDAAFGARFLPHADRTGSPEWAEWVATARTRIAPAGNLAGGLRPGVRRVVIGVATLVAAVTGVTITRGRPDPRFRAGDPVLLADLDNVTGDTLFDRSLTAAAGVSFGQTPQVFLVPRSRIAAALKRMAIANPDTAITGALALEVAARENVPIVVALGIEPSGGGFRLRVRLTDVRQNVVRLDEAAQAETRNGTLLALDRLLTAVRATLSKSGPVDADQRLGLPLVTTPSLEALRSFADGGIAWRKGEYRIAAELWERALVLDTGFAMAYKALGGYYSLHNIRDQAERNFQEALRRINRLTELERLQTLERYADFRGDTDSALSVSRQIATRYSGAVSWYNYGVSLQNADRLDSALTALRRVLDFDSTHTNAISRMAFVSSAMGRWSDAVRYYHVAARVDSLILYRGNLSLEYGSALVNDGQPGAARLAFERTRSDTDQYTQVLGSRGLGYLAIYQGRYDEAVGRLREAAELARQKGGGLSEVRGRLLVAATLAVAGDTAAAVAEFSRAESLLDPSIPPFARALLGHAMVLAGQVAMAERVLHGLERVADSTRGADRAIARYLAGDIALARGDAKTALLLLRPRSDYSGAVVEIRTAEAFMALGQPDSADAMLRGARVDWFTPSERMFDWYPALALRSAIHLSRSEPKLAAAVWRNALKRWSGGDSTAVPFVRARAELATLERDR